jgi:hypothetical protein
MWHLKKPRTTWVNRVQMFTIHLAHRLTIQPADIRQYRFYQFFDAEILCKINLFVKTNIFRLNLGF